MNEKPKFRILLIDDDEDLCKTISDVLMHEGNYDIHYVTDPFKSLVLIENQEYDLVMLDYKMPEANGIEVLKTIKKIKPNTKVFILTAFISTELIKEAQKFGAEKVLSKFIFPDEIIKHISEALAG